MDRHEPVSEREFQAQVMELAHRYGWHVAHFRPSQTANGRWLTAISGDPGYPDLTLAHPTKGVLFAELKTDTGRLAPHQVDWLRALHRGAQRGTAAVLWRPADLEQIIATLVRGTTRSHRGPRGGTTGPSTEGT